jgi:hypothetical protein
MVQHRGYAKSDRSPSTLNVSGRSSVPKTGSKKFVPRSVELSGTRKSQVRWPVEHMA